MDIEWAYGQNKYYRKPLSEEEKEKILALEKGEYFSTNDLVKWLTVYRYEDGEFVICLDQLGECYYEGSQYNSRFMKNIRLEQGKHVLLFIHKYISNDKYFLT